MPQTQSSIENTSQNTVFGGSILEKAKSINPGGHTYHPVSIITVLHSNSVIYPVKS